MSYFDESPIDHLTIGLVVGSVLFKQNLLYGLFDFGSKINSVQGTTYGMHEDGACIGPAMAADFFKINTEPAIYNSNGQGHYCSFNSHDSFMAAGGRQDATNVQSVNGIVTGMANDGTCL